MNAPSLIEIDCTAIASAAVPSLEQKRVRAYLWLVIGDVLAIVGAFLVAGAFYRGAVPDQQALLQAWLFLPVYLTIALYQRVYSIRGLTDGVYAAKRMIIAVIVAAALLNFLAFYARYNTSFSRGSFTIGLLLSVASMAGVRLWCAALLRRRWGALAQNVIIIRDGGPEFSLHYAQTIDAADFALEAIPHDPEMLHRFAQSMRHQERIIVCCLPSRRDAWTEMLRTSGLHGEIISNTASDAGIIGISRYDERATGLVVSTGPLGLRSRFLKRVFDLVVACLGLLVSFPVLIFAALAIKLEDGGPMLFVQQRMGRGNHLFKVLKFRSMRIENEDLDGVISTSRGDERVTRIGAFLRRTSIDELPQLINVLAGDMSIVGPRPHALGSQAGDKLFWEVDQRYWHRHSLKPGLTGLAQVRGLRGATEVEGDLSARLQSDLEYIANWSLLRDFGILAKTMFVLRSEKAF